jgi:hypothetical protein
MGITADGIARELLSIQNSTNFCKAQELPLLPLATTAKLGVLRLAERLVGSSWLGSYPLWDCQAMSVAILPFLGTMLDEVSAVAINTIDNHAALIAVTVQPDTYADTTISPNVTDPFGNDYTCKICKQELWNMYYQCEGCLNLLQQDFLICYQCYNHVKHLGFHDTSDKLKTIIEVTNKVHFGRMETDERCSACSKSRSKKPAKCNHCKKCYNHQCHCHSQMTLHYRFYLPKNLADIYARLRAICTQKDG